MIAILRFLAEGARAAALLALLSGVRGYQLWISPLLPSSCRFRPTCSQYAMIALRRYGPVVGSWKSLRRILRCHPWNPGGWDPP